jgi:hypothetical protein
VFSRIRDLGTDREISASFDRESSATQVDRATCGKAIAYINLVLCHSLILG